MLSELISALAVMKKQQTRALKNPDKSVVFNRDFSKEIMQFGDVTDLLFSENSNYGQALGSGTKLLENNSKSYEKDLPALMQLQEKQL